MSELTEGRPRILIADDEPEIRGILRHLLGTEYECREVNSAEAALALLDSEKFALVLSDIMMGGLTGLDMVPLVLERAPDTVIILISGVQSVESAIEALRAGAFVLTSQNRSICITSKRPSAAQSSTKAPRGKARLRGVPRGFDQQRTDEIKHLSNHDALTDLPNRILFEDRLAQALIAPQRHKQTLAVMFINPIASR